MKKTFPIIIAYAIIFLFFIQSAGTLVEAIYILNLMNSSLNANALGVLFFFTPAILIPLHKRYPREIVWIVFIVLLLTRGFLPYLETSYRVLAAGFATLACIYLILLIPHAGINGNKVRLPGSWGSTGLALALGSAVFMRTLDHGLDFSLTIHGGWVGWILGLSLGWSISQLNFQIPPEHEDKRTDGVTSTILGIFHILALIWFSFSAPSVIARWTEGNYTLIVLTISLVALGWVLFSLIRPGFLNRISPTLLLVWNILFTISLTATILVHRVDFPPTPDAAAVTIYTPYLLEYLPLVLTLLLYPVLFFDLKIFINRFQNAAPTPSQLLPGILLGGLMLTLLIFSHIFTNVWGYVKPVSTIFRNLFWLPYFAIAGIVTMLIAIGDKKMETPANGISNKFHWAWGLLLILLFGGTLFYTFPRVRVHTIEEKRTSLVVMTFNTQQSNDQDAEKSYDRQLELIRRVSPDILALQESDSTRIGLNNNDYVRYFAEKLGYYSYYGPTTVTGTYGTAILSKYPLENTRTVFTYSDKDEIGTSEAEIVVNGIRFTIINVHPDGSDTAMLAFARALLERTKGISHVIILGDFNLRDYEEAYQLIDNAFTNSWTSVYPEEVSPDGIDMSGDSRIDHIFLSADLFARNPIYILPPDSATDHPVHWTEVYWEGE